MANAKSAWGVEVGSFAVKAVRLERDGAGAKVTDFAVIPHSRVLSTPDVDVDEVVRISLGQFVSQKAVDKTPVAVSVPGNVAFSAFTRLPPHEPKQTPNLVRFEAEQQIPFPITEVEWDFKTFTSDDSPEVEVGIFALQRGVLDERLGLYAELGIEPDLVTMSPLALYNAVAFDLELNEQSKPVVILDIATRHSDLIVAEAGRCWFRRLPVGGHDFTSAIAEAFKISYAKAEQLKQEGATGKYAKQVMQAMRPVFTELLESVQRSLEYYKTTANLDTVIGVGSTFRIPGLRKFLGTQLQKDVVRLDEFRKIRVEGPEAADFATSTVNLWTAYGLALQEIGGAAADVNLAPVEVLRQQLWNSKRVWFAGAAAVAFLTGAAMFGRYVIDSAGLRSDEAKALSAVQNVERNHSQFQNRLDGIIGQATGGNLAGSLISLADYRDVWPKLTLDVTRAVESGSDPALLNMTPAQLKNENPKSRQLVLLDSLTGTYSPEGSGNSAKRFIDVSVDVSYSNAQSDYLNTTVCKWLRDEAQKQAAAPTPPFRILGDSISYNPASIQTLVVNEDGTMKNTTSASGGSNNANRPPRQDREQSSGGNTATIDSGQGFGGKQAGNRDEVAAPGGGMIMGSGSGGGSTAPADLSGANTDEQLGYGASSGSSSGNRDKETTMGALDVIAPIPPEPGLFAPGSEYHRGRITFRIEILDPAQPKAGGNS